MQRPASSLRLLPTNPGLALYIRPRRNDHKELLALLTDDRLPAGIVLDPVLASRQAELRDEANRLGVETVLDTLTMELSMPGGAARRGALDLPWAPAATRPAAAMTGEIGREFVRSIADYAQINRVSAVLSPAHYISGPDDASMAVDRRLCADLRTELDRRRLTRVAIYYPLALPLAKLRDPGQAMMLAERLKNLDIDGIWLRLHPFGTSSSGPVSIRTYIVACRALQTLPFPIVAERTGTIGIALMAFGAVGGIECGVTVGERFNVTDLLAPRSDGSAFDPQAQVYLQSIGMFLSRVKAARFFVNPLMRARYGCADATCCSKGVSSTLANPRRHGFIQRLAEVKGLAAVPQQLRADHYLEEFLRPATDAAFQAVKVESSLESRRRQLEATRTTLGALRKRGRPVDCSPPPSGRRANQDGERRPKAL